MTRAEAAAQVAAARSADYMNIDNCKSYATEENLWIAIAKADLMDCRPIIVRNREGRYTAIFSIAHMPARLAGAVFLFAHYGFMTTN